MAIYFLTDSTSDISPQEGERRNITVVPLGVTFGDTTYRDNVDIDHATFYEKLVASDRLPTTSQPPPEAFLPAFQAAKEAGDTLICVMLSAGLSGTYQGACIAKELCDYENIYVIDSTQAVAGIRLLVDLGCLLRDQGKTAQEIVAELEAVKGKIRLYAILDTLTYLHKGGRLSAAVTLMGTMMKVKPIITMENGVLDLCGKGVGTKDGMAKLAKRLEGVELDPRLPLYLGYTRDFSAIEKLSPLLKDLHPHVPQECHSVGAVIGTHVGPGGGVITFLEA